ncbi:SRPBCC family protein [Streptomyces sp. NPDC057638]|uniref:SRPBCC family protein n=1 Tax=Streptomyces sp. NPDC057638 TaxID=3346190 RepID=UPI0036C07600
MDWGHYRFHSVWELPAAPEAVLAVLERAEEYPRWWPQVRSVTPLTDRSGQVRFRSRLPWELTVTVRARPRDLRSRMIDLVLTGDLEGWARWTLLERRGGTRLDMEQAVRLRKPLLGRWAPLCRPVLRANHAAMMRSGRRGLSALLRSR